MGPCWRRVPSGAMLVLLIAVGGLGGSLVYLWSRETPPDFDRAERRHSVERSVAIEADQVTRLLAMASRIEISPRDAPSRILFASESRYDISSLGDALRLTRRETATRRLLPGTLLIRAYNGARAEILSLSLRKSGDSIRSWLWGADLIFLRDPGRLSQWLRQRKLPDSWNPPQASKPEW
jgi:hypothetical protein